MRIGIVAAWAVLAAACSLFEPLEGEQTSPEPQQDAPVPGVPVIGTTAVVALSSLEQDLRGRAIPQNATAASDDREWKLELFATPTTATAANRRPGIGNVTANAVFKRHTKKKPPSGWPSENRCTSARKWGSNLVSLDWTQTYQDPQSSSLKGEATNPTTQAVCTNGREFKIVAKGAITGGSGKFGSVTGGDWTATIDVSSDVCNPKGKWCPASGTLTVSNLTRN